MTVEPPETDVVPGERVHVDHLLRTLAAVPVGSRLLDLGGGGAERVENLARLGFDLWTCDSDSQRVASTRCQLALLLGEEQADARATFARPDALGFPEEHFDWVVADSSYDQANDATDLVSMLEETMRVLKSGGWVFVIMSSSVHGPELTVDTFAKLVAEAGFALAENPVDDEGYVRGIFRKVGRGVGA